MEAKILLSLNDIENVHDTCFGTIFNIKGIQNREFQVNKHGYVFEFLGGEYPHKQIIWTNYYVKWSLNNLLNDY